MTRARLTEQERAFRAKSEKEWHAEVVALLQWHGYSVYHAWSSQHSEAGFPDLFAIHKRTGDRFAAELKTQTGRLSEHQLRWMALFDLARIDWYCWRPSDVDVVLARASSPTEPQGDSGERQPR